MTADIILLALVPVFFVLALGYGAGRLGIVENHHVDGLNALVMMIALPASIFAATASASRGEMLAQAPVFLIFGAVMLVVYAFWYVVARRLAQAGKADASVQALTIAFPNLAGVGLPIGTTLLGPTGTVTVAVALAAGSLLVSPLTLIAAELTTHRDAAAAPARQILKSVRAAVSKPIVIAPALGILCSLIGLKPGPVVDACLQLIGHAAAGVALFLTGLILSAQAFKLNWPVAGATILADIARPLLTAAAVYALPVSPDVARATILIAAVPSGFFGILFAVNYRLDFATAGSMVIASTGFSAVTMAVAIALLFPQ